MIIKKVDYQKYADCIRMDQVSAPEINELFEDEKFHNWYKRKYLMPGLFTNQKEINRAIKAAVTQRKNLKK
jgi:hypothetical protein